MNTRALSSEWETEVQRSRTVLLNRLSLAFVIVGGIGVSMLIYRLLYEPGTLARSTVVAAIFGWLVTLVALIGRRLNYYVRATSLLLVTFMLNIMLFAQNRRLDRVDTWMLLPLALAFILLGPRLGLAVGGGVSLLLFASFCVAIHQKWVIPGPVEDPTLPATLITQGVGYALAAVLLALVLWVSSRGWLEALERTSAANRQLAARSEDLEYVNGQLRRQHSQLQATAEIARACSAILDPDSLARELVGRIQEGFAAMGVYYVGLFLLDETRQYAVLEAATGEAGRLLLGMGHKLEVNESTPVGWCIVHQQANIVLDEDSAQPNGLPMPHTRSEIVLPLRSHGRILGALSLQSTYELAFGEADVVILQMMADQVATAISNARLFSQTEAALQDVQAAYRRYLAQAWKEYLARRPIAQVDYVQPGVEQVDERFLNEARRAAIMHERTVATTNSPPFDYPPSAPQAALAVPLKLRGQVIGTLTLHETQRHRTWDAEEIAIAEAVAEQVAQTIENLRLMDEMQRRASRERTIREISDRMQRAADMEMLMRITAEELHQALGGLRAYVRLGDETEPQPQDDGHTDEGV